MRMDEMNKLFEEQGFTVERKWENDGYRFTICKDGMYYTDRFVYPSGASSRYGSQVQRDFVQNTIKKFYKEFPFCDENVKTATLDPKFTYKPLLATDKINELVGGIKAFDLLYPNKFYIDTDVVTKDIQIKQDFDIFKEMWTKMNPWIQTNIKIKDVIFNDPATIVFWSDGSKTVVKCQDDDIFDPEKGLAMAISKKALGNKGNYCNELKKWLPKEEPLNPVCEGLKKGLCFDVKVPDTSKLADAVKAFRNFGKTVSEMNKKTAVQKAYDILVGWRDGKIPVCNEVKDNMCTINTLINYLEEALED